MKHEMLSVIQDTIILILINKNCYNFDSLNCYRFYFVFLLYYVLAILLFFVIYFIYSMSI